MTTDVHHPCPYSKALMPYLIEACAGVSASAGRFNAVLLDPMAGTGKAVEIAEACGYEYVGVEIEEPWADAHPGTILGDSQKLTEIMSTHPLGPLVDVVCTSAAYGGRMADGYLGTKAERELRAATGQMPRRRGYAISLGRKPDPESGAGTGFTRKYKRIHGNIIDQMFQVIRPGGRAVINVSNFIKGKNEVDVVGWWEQRMIDAGFLMVLRQPVETRRYKDGANRDLRAAAEYILTFTKPGDTR